jgi:hypothetical protein
MQCLQTEDESDDGVQLCGLRRQDIRAQEMSGRPISGAKDLEPADIPHRSGSLRTL